MKIGSKDRHSIEKKRNGAYRMISAACFDLKVHGEMSDRFIKRVKSGKM